MIAMWPGVGIRGLILPDRLLILQTLSSYHGFGKIYWLFHSVDRGNRLYLIHLLYET